MQFNYSMAQFALPDGSVVEFDHYEFSAAVAMAEIPTAPDAAGEAMKRLAAVVSEVIPSIASRSEAFRAGVGLRINQWLEETTSGKGGGRSSSSASPTGSDRGTVPTI